MKSIWFICETMLARQKYMAYNTSENESDMEESMNRDLTVGEPEKVLWRFCLPLFGSVIF